MNETTNTRLPKPEIEPTPDASDVKRAVNGLLWERLPPCTTLRDAEVIACDITEKIMALWFEYERSEKP